MPTPSALGFDLPTPAYLAGLLLFSLIGYVAFRRGRKAESQALTWLGVALMVYPYATPQTWLLWLVGTLGCAGVYFAWN